MTDSKKTIQLAEMHDQEGSPIYFNGAFKFIIGGVIVAMWGLLVLMGSGYAKNTDKKIDKNTDRVGAVELVQVGIKKDLEYIKQAAKEQKASQEKQSELLQKILAEQKRDRNKDD